jgi:parallel beta-helix repeat protein
MKKHLSVFLFLELVFICFLSATNYYCSPSGNSSNSGLSPEDPWGILEEVFSSGKIFEGGDTIWLMSGNQGFPLITGKNSVDVIIAGYLNEDPILNRICFSGASHWVLDNVKIHALTVPPEPPVLEHPVYPIANNTLVRIIDASTFITLSDCYIYSIENSSAWTANQWNYNAWNGIGVDGGCSFNTIRSCHIKNVNFALELSGSNYTMLQSSLVENFCGDGIIPGDNCTVENNLVRDSYKTNGNHCDLVQAFWISNLLFQNNRLIAKTANHSSVASECQGIGLFDGTFNNCLIVNNLVVVETYHGITLYNAENCKIINNTLIDMTAEDLIPWISITGSGNLVRNNICPTLSTIEASSDHNLILSRSKYKNNFADSDNQDYHLKSGSIAIDAGILTNAPSMDLENVPRPQYSGPDAGAYEYNAGPDTLLPTTPANLKSSILTSSGFTLTWSASTDNIRVSSYDVFLNGNFLSNVPAPPLLINGLEDSTIYAVTIQSKDAAGNSSEASSELIVTTLAQKTEIEQGSISEDQVVIYPNPVSRGGFYIHQLMRIGGKIKVEILNLNGEIVYSKLVSAASSIPIEENLSSGTYIARITYNEKTVVQKLFVE